jgi:hypothetical protein
MDSDKIKEMTQSRGIPSKGGDPRKSELVSDIVSEGGNARSCI